MITKTDAEKLTQAWDIYQIKNLMGRRAFYASMYDGDREIRELWVSLSEYRETACFGDNRGYQLGIEQIRENLCTGRKRRLEELSDPAKTCLSGSGCMEFHALTTPYIYISDDGSQAQGMWYSPGQRTVTGKDGAKAAYVFRRVAADFVKEKGRWKIWHLFEGTDLMLRPGTDFSEQDVDSSMVDLYDNLDFTKRTYEFNAYTSRYNWCPFPRFPKPFAAITEENTLAPEGNPFFTGRLS